MSDSALPKCTSAAGSMLPLSFIHLPVRPSPHPVVPPPLTAAIRPGSNDAPEFFATCARGLGPAVAAELPLSIPEATIQSVSASGVRFSAPSLHAGYRAAFWLRSATRVLHRLGGGRDAAADAYGFVRDELGGLGDWVARGQTFVVDVRASDEDAGVGQTVGRRVKDSVCDALRDRDGVYVGAPRTREEADVPIFVAVNRGDLEVYRDLGGVSLHKRGYRTAMHRASLNESVAAGMLVMSGWLTADVRREAVLMDPFCGSGTLLLEAALMDAGIAPGLLRRRFAFETWEDTPPGVVQQLRREARGAMRAPTAREYRGNDVHPGALSLARSDAEAAGVDNLVQWQCGDIADWAVGGNKERAMVVTNPPWGGRLGGDGRVEDAWTGLGQFLRRECAGGKAFLLCGNPEVTRHVRMKTRRKVPIRVGNVDCRILEYEVFAAREGQGQ